MEKIEYAVLTFASIILIFLSLSIPTLIGLSLFSVALLLVSIFNMLESNNIIKLASNLLLLAGILSLIPFLGINLLVINRISTYIMVFAVILLVLYYLYLVFKVLLSSIEVKVR